MTLSTDNKVCPQCQASVREATRICRHCRHEFHVASRYGDLAPIAGWVLVGGTCLGYVWMQTH